MKNLRSLAVHVADTDGGHGGARRDSPFAAGDDEESGCRRGSTLHLWSWVELQSWGPGETGENALNATDDTRMVDLMTWEGGGWVGGGG